MTTTLHIFLVTWHFDEHTDACVVEATDEKDALRLAIAAKLEEHRDLVADSELDEEALRLARNPTHITDEENWAVRRVNLRGKRGVHEATFALPAPRMPMAYAEAAQKALYFGVHPHQEAGHFFWTTQWDHGDEPWRVPETLHKVHRHFDAGWPPATRSRRLVTSPRAYTIVETDERPPGMAAVGHHNGWTVVSWWDRSGDDRGASHSTILIPAIVEEGLELAVAERAFPAVFARYRKHYNHSPSIHTRLPDGDLQEYVR